MQNKKTIILVILAVLAIFSLFYGLNAKPKSKISIQPAQKEAFQNDKIELQKNIVVIKRCAKKTQFVGWGRDPFSLKVALALNGILWDDNLPQAIIGDNVVKVGDKVGNNTVVSILKDRVILNDGTRDLEFELKGN